MNIAAFVLVPFAVLGAGCSRSGGTAVDAEAGGAGSAGATSTGGMSSAGGNGGGPSNGGSSNGGGGASAGGSGTGGGSGGGFGGGSGAAGGSSNASGGKGGGLAPCQAECVPGPCSPVPLATGLAGPKGLTVDASHVYFTNTGADTVMKVAKQGGAPAIIVPPKSNSAEQPFGIAVSGASIYWTSYFRSFIGQAGLNGESPVELATGQTYPQQIVADATSLYWMIAGQIRKVSRAGGTPVTLIASNVRDLAVDGSAVYWTSSNLSTTGGEVMKMGLSGTEPRVLATGLMDPRGVAVDGVSVYWADYRNGSVAKVSLEGGATTTLAMGQTNPAFVAVDATDVYWTSSPTAKDGGAILRVGRAGGIPQLLASGQDRPTRIVLDQCAVYWIDEGAGTIMKLPKSSTLK